MTAIQKRLQRAAESVLENEALTSDLNDDAAQVLLDWGVARAQQIAAETVEMDDAQAEEAMYRPMRALRKMLRTTNKWALAPNESGLEKIIEQASITYGSGYAAPGTDQRAAFIERADQWASNPPEMIRQLRQFTENQTTP